MGLHLHHSSLKNAVWKGVEFYLPHVEGRKKATVNLLSIWDFCLIFLQLKDWFHFGFCPDCLVAWLI